MNGKPATSHHSTFPTLARLAIENKILTEEQVKTALKNIMEEKNKGRQISFEDYLQQHRIISEDILKRLLAATVRHLDKKFAELAVLHGLVDKEYVDKALDAQKKAFARGVLMPISDILMKWNHLTIRQRDQLLEIMASDKPRHTEFDPTPESPQAKPQTSPAQNIPGQSLPSPALERKETVAPPETMAKKILADDDTEENNSPLTIEIADKGLKALLHVPGDLTDKPTLQSVKELIAKYEITYGIMEDALLEEQLAKSGNEPVMIVVAKGLVPDPGKSASIKLYFDNNYLAPGAINEDGTIDFKDRGDVPFVNMGDLIAEKKPAIKGKPGMDVFGQTIPVEDVEDVSFKPGSDTKASEDGNQIYASADGQPFMTVHGEICVFKELHIKGDVDYSTGNISFNGNIFVRGSIKEGFTVKGGNLTAKDVQGAVLDIKGNIDISGGIIDSVITQGGNLQAMYVTGTKIDAYGDVMVKKEIIDSKVRTSGLFSGDQLHVISSFISAKKGVEVKKIGTDVSQPCTIRIGISDHTNKIIKNYKTILEETKGKLAERQENMEKMELVQQKSQEEIMDKANKQDQLNRQKKAINTQIGALGDDAQSQEERKKLEAAIAGRDSEIKSLDKEVTELFSKQDHLTDSILSVQNQCEILVEQIENLNGQIKDVKNWEKKAASLPQVRVVKEIEARTSIFGPNSTLVLKENHRNVTIREIRRTSHPGMDWELAIESNSK